MKRIAYIVPYFGSLPGRNFQLWLDSCANNPTIDWLIFTDDQTKYKYPANVKVHHISFDEMHCKIQSLYDFRISLLRPYRLCDFKVAYGDIFKDYLVDYDYWGYCDIDLVWGNIRHFITEEVLEENEKIGWLGHSALYRNTEAMRNLYREKLQDKELYKEYFAEDGNHFFDEKAINQLCDEYGHKVWRELCFADISPLKWDFRLSQRMLMGGGSHCVFLYNAPSLMSYIIRGKEIECEEFMYVHFLRRRMHFSKSFQNSQRYLISPNVFSDCPHSVTKSFLLSCGKNRPVKYWCELIWAKRHKMNFRNVITYIKARIRANENVRRQNLSATGK